MQLTRALLLATRALKCKTLAIPDSTCSGTTVYYTIWKKANLYIYLSAHRQCNQLCLGNWLEPITGSLGSIPSFLTEMSLQCVRDTAWWDTGTADKSADKCALFCCLYLSIEHLALLEHYGSLLIGFYTETLAFHSSSWQGHIDPSDIPCTIIVSLDRPSGRERGSGKVYTSTATQKHG